MIVQETIFTLPIYSINWHYFFNLPVDDPVKICKSDWCDSLLNNAVLLPTVLDIGCSDKHWTLFVVNIIGKKYEYNSYYSLILSLIRESTRTIFLISKVWWNQWIHFHDRLHTLYFQVRIARIFNFCKILKFEWICIDKTTEGIGIQHYSIKVV